MQNVVVGQEIEIKPGLLAGPSRVRPDHLLPSKVETHGPRIPPPGPPNVSPPTATQNEVEAQEIDEIPQGLAALVN